MEIKPIRTDADYRAALIEVSSLMDAMAGTADSDRLDVLATLVEAYETHHFPIEAPDPIEAIKFMMEQKLMTRRDLESALGGSGRVSEIMNRKRALSIQMIRALHELLEIPTDVLLQPYELAKAA